MDISEPVVKLQIITLLDSTCFGLIVGFITPYLLSLCMDHLVIGIMSVGNLICGLLSADIVNNIVQTHGKQYTLYIILNIAMVTHLLLSLTNSYWLTIFARNIFSLTNQSQDFCKDLLLRKAPKEEQEHISIRFSILSGAGYIIGPFISGCIFNMGFGYICLLAAILTFVNSYLIMTIPIEPEEPPPTPDETTLVEKTQDNIIEVLHQFTKSNYEKNWDILAIKYLYISSITIFLTKFTQILRHNFNASAFVIGYTSSYMNSLAFAGAFFATGIRNTYLPSYSILTLTKYALMVAGVSALIACYAPVYSLYVIMCIPAIFTNSFFNSSWRDIFSTRENDPLNKINNSVGIVARLTIPLIFGIVCNAIGHHAVIIFSVGSVATSLYIIDKYTEHVLPQEKSEKSKDD